MLTRKGQIELRQGEPRSAAPLPPTLEKGERRLANIWLPGRVDRLVPEHLFPVLETAYPEPRKAKPTPAEQFCPKAIKKLRLGQPLRILAWGDSVTVGSFVPDWEHNRWQEQFVARLKARFRHATIELLTEAWGGRNTSSYLGEPPGSPHNYQEKVLALKPDLIISDFSIPGLIGILHSCWPSNMRLKYLLLLSPDQSAMKSEKIAWRLVPQNLSAKRPSGNWGRLF